MAKKTRKKAKTKAAATRKKTKVSKARKVAAKTKRKAVKKTKRKAKAKSKTFRQRVAGAFEVVTDTIRGTDALRNKLEPPATSETE